jgi:hypothetical protein
MRSAVLEMDRCDPFLVLCLVGSVAHCGSLAALLPILRASAVDSSSSVSPGRPSAAWHFVGQPRSHPPAQMLHRDRQGTSSLARIAGLSTIPASGTEAHCNAKKFHPVNSPASAYLSDSIRIPPERENILEPGQRRINEALRRLRAFGVRCVRSPGEKPS